MYNVPVSSAVMSDPLLTRKRKKGAYHLQNRTNRQEEDNLAIYMEFETSTVASNSWLNILDSIVDSSEDAGENLLIVRSGILPKLIKRALHESPSDDWRRELDEL